MLCCSAACARLRSRYQIAASIYYIACLSTATTTTAAFDRLFHRYRNALLALPNRSTSHRNMSADASADSVRHFKVWANVSREAVAHCIPPLSDTSHKGSSGRIGVLGGSDRYTGAPYYAAMAALWTGADLATVLTAQEAALPIKCYSPELMVQVVYSVSEFDQFKRTLWSHQAIPPMVQKVEESMDRLHCLIVGPGMGRCPLVMKAVARIIQKARQRGLYMVLDADALFMLAQDEYRDLLKGYDRAVLTPNAIEYSRLYEKVTEGSSDPFESVTIVQKGKVDHILVNGSVAMSCHENGGLKRAGGIGDVLSGAIGTMVAWQSILHNQKQDGQLPMSSVDLPLACWTACCLVKKATERAFNLKQRAMSASDILDQLGGTMHDMTKTFE
jgi:ATP-dependent NAD(P)H-hydrate dehydratase